jgi:hypothetical protein
VRDKMGLANLWVGYRFWRQQQLYQPRVVLGR